MNYGPSAWQQIIDAQQQNQAITTSGVLMLLFFAICMAIAVIHSQLEKRATQRETDAENRGYAAGYKAAQDERQRPRLPEIPKFSEPQ